MSNLIVPKVLPKCTVTLQKAGVINTPLLYMWLVAFKRNISSLLKTNPARYTVIPSEILSHTHKCSYYSVLISVSPIFIEKKHTKYSKHSKLFNIRYHILSTENS